MILKNSVILGVAISAIFITILVSFEFKYLPVVSGQLSNSTYQTNLIMLHNISEQKVKVGDIDIAYKQFGNSSNNSTPIILISGGATTMDMWDPTLIKALSSNRTVIIFDNRGIGETNSGTKEFSIVQFANDTAGLLKELKIANADVLGWSMGSLVAQQFALTSPDMVNRLVLYGSNCGGNEAIPPGPEVLQHFTGYANSSHPLPDEKKIESLYYPSEWLKANQDFKGMPVPKKPIDPDVLQRQVEAASTWNGTCADLPKFNKPTLVVVGTEDVFAPPINSLIITEKIPEAWLIQIRNAGHGLMYQFPDEFSRIVLTFLDTFR